MGEDSTDFVVLCALVQLLPFAKYPHLVVELEKIQIYQPLDLLYIRLVVMDGFKLPAFGPLLKNSLPRYRNLSAFEVVLEFFFALKEALLWNNGTKILKLLNLQRQLILMPV